MFAGSYCISWTTNKRELAHCATYVPYWESSGKPSATYQNTMHNGHAAFVLLITATSHWNLLFVFVSLSDMGLVASAASWRTRIMHAFRGTISPLDRVAAYCTDNAAIHFKWFRCRSATNRRREWKWHDGQTPGAPLSINISIKCFHLIKHPFSQYGWHYRQRVRNNGDWNAKAMKLIPTC